MKKQIIGMTLLCLTGTVNLHAQSWRSHYQKLLKDGKDVSALQYLWTQTARGTKAAEHRERAMLLDLAGFPILALREWADAARGQPNNSAFLEGFGEAALKWDRLGSVSTVVKAAKNANPAQWPVAFKVAVALHAYRSGNYSLASRLLPRPNDLKGIRNLEAQRAVAVHLATIQWGLGQTTAAQRTLQAVLGSEATVGAGLLRLQSARLYYDMGLMTQSLEQLVKLPRNSGSWYPGLIVGAWAAYRLKDYNLSLGQLLTLHSPYLNSKFAPETYILEAATLFQLCQFQAAQKSVDRLREKYRGVVSALQIFSRTYSDANSRVNATMAYARGQRVVPSGTNQAAYDLLMDGLLQEEVLVRADRLIIQQKFEADNLSKILSPNNQPLLQSLKNSYDSELRYSRIEAYRNAGRAINKRLKVIQEDIAAALENASLVEVEINTKIRERLIDVKAPRPVAVNYEAEIRKGFEFWPFEGEFWRDELGTYAFATSDVCGEQNL